MGFFDTVGNVGGDILGGVTYAFPQMYGDMLGAKAPGGTGDVYGQLGGGALGGGGGVFGQGTGSGSGPFGGLPYNLPGGQTAVGPNNISGAQTNQGNAFNQQQSFVNALQGQNALGLQSNVANQLQNTASGTGPNPAQAMLAQNTGNNISQQAALMNSARGANANPGLMAQLGAQQGGNIQQQAAGQAATLQAQQQIAAQQQLAGLSSQMAGQLQGGIGGLNQYALQNQGQQYGGALQQNQTAAGIAQQQLAGQQGLLGGLLGGAGALGAASLLGGGGGAAAGGAAGGGAAALGGGFLGDAPAIGAALAKGGIVKKYADGGQVDSEGPRSILGQFSQGVDTYMPGINGGNPPSNNIQQSILNPINQAIGMSKAAGGKIPGKANVKGDSYSNDTVNAKLSPGEVVIPRSKVGNPHETAHFLNALLGYNLRA